MAQYNTKNPPLGRPEKYLGEGARLTGGRHYQVVMLNTGSTANTTHFLYSRYLSKAQAKRLKEKG